MKRERWDFRRPDTDAVRREITSRTYTAEGFFSAFPLCFPGVTTPIAPDESRVSALDVSPGGVVCGGTSGRRAHVFVADLRAARGVVLDLGAVEGTDACVGLCAGAERLTAVVDGGDGARVVVADLPRMPGDLLQEWSFRLPPLEVVAAFEPGERAIHAVCDGSRRRLAVATSRRLVVVEPGTGRVVQAHAVSRAGRLAALGDAVYGPDDDGASLWRYDTARDELQRGAVPLPRGVDGRPTSWTWRAGAAGRLYGADAAGRLHALGADGRFGAPLWTAPAGPVGPMAVTLDGRLYGFAGEGIARMFTVDPEAGAVRDLGVAVSVLERRRYGYAFASAAVGLGGEIYFGEDDTLGHLWVYFPAVRAAAARRMCAQ